MDAAAKKTVCVTGSGGFVASWLVKLLLSRGHYVVHGTVRNPSDAKNAHLKALEGAAERLRLFKAELLDYAAVAAAVAGCEDVFHVATPVLPSNTPNPEEKLFAPAVTGTTNVLKACSEAKVKRVVVVSSVSAIMANPNWPEGKPMDEDCWSDVEYCRTTGTWYCLSKAVAEREALDYAKKTGLDVVTLCPSLVIGPLLQSTVNASTSIIVDYLKGASGRYICHSHSRKVSDVIGILKSLYPTCKYAKEFIEVPDEPTFTSTKLQMLGWKIRPLEETLRDSVESYLAAGLLN